MKVDGFVLELKNLRFRFSQASFGVDDNRILLEIENDSGNVIHSYIQPNELRNMAYKLIEIVDWA
jgi:hypothetical protein